MIKAKRTDHWRRKRILEAAGQLFALHGYERTTLSMIAKGAGAAIGSIEHFFGHKPDLAAAVHEDVIVSLTGLIEKTLDAHPYEASEAVPALLAAYFAWAKVNPHHQRLLCVLADCAVSDPQTQANGLQERLEPILLAWAQPLIANRKIRPLTANHLFALIMAPAMVSAIAETEFDAERSEISPDWPSVLASIVIKAITRSTSQPVRAAHSRPDPKAHAMPPPPPDDLFTRRT